MQRCYAPDSLIRLRSYGLIRRQSSERREITRAKGGSRTTANSGDRPWQGKTSTGQAQIRGFTTKPLQAGHAPSPGAAFVCKTTTWQHTAHITRTALTSPGARIQLPGTRTPPPTLPPTPDPQHRRKSAEGLTRGGASSSGANTATRAVPARGPTRPWSAHLELQPTPPDGAARPSEPRPELCPDHRPQGSRPLFLARHNCCRISLAQNYS